MHLHKPTIFYGLDSNHPSHGNLWPGFPCWGTSSRPGRLKIHWFVSAADPNVSICYASEIDGEIGCFRDGCGHQAGSMFQTPACKVNLQVDFFGNDATATWHVRFIQLESAAGFLDHLEAEVSWMCCRRVPKKILTDDMRQVSMAGGCYRSFFAAVRWWRWWFGTHQMLCGELSTKKIKLLSRFYTPLISTQDFTGSHRHHKYS